VRIGDEWIPIWYLGPFALAFGIPAAAKYYMEERTEALTEDETQRLFDLSEGLARFIGSQSSTQSMGALFSALNGDIDFKFSSQSGFTAGQMIPASGMVRYINTILDPVIRHPHGFIESMEKDIPILSERLNARLTPLMEEARRDPINYFLPYDIGRADSTYDSLMPMKQYEIRTNRIESQIHAVIRKVKDKEITVEESLERILELQQAGPKAIELLGKELLKKGDSSKND
jgi:hypothetical protein